MRDRTRLFLAGDVMLGRGIDQMLPHPGDPTLHERHVTDARRYVELVEQVSGAVPRPVEPAWPWGESLAALDRAAPDVRILNLETSITRSDHFALGKAVHYRMHPANLAGLTIVRPDVCTLANNHVLDLGREGLTETLAVLSAAGLAATGAGRDLEQAWRPAVVELDGGEDAGADGDDGSGEADGGDARSGHAWDAHRDRRRVLVVSMGVTSSGIPSTWAATEQRSGVAALDTPLASQAPQVLKRLGRWRRPDDLVVASVHWGSNWGYEVDDDQIAFAHALIDGGVDVVHGHSSHHPRPLEIYRDRLILYGCGDLINDYEGITGHEAYRGDLRLLYLVDLDPGSGALTALRMVALQSHRLRLRAATDADTRWLAATLERTCPSPGHRIGTEPGGTLVLQRP